LEVGGQTDALFGEDVAVCYVADYFFAGLIGRGLGKGNVDYGGLTPDFGVFDCEDGRPDLGSPQEIEVEGYGVGLVLGGEGAAEMGRGYSEEDGCYEAAVRDC